MLNSVSKLPVQKETGKADNKNTFLSEIDITSIKDFLLKETDVSSIKEVLTKDIVSGKENSDSVDETILLEQSPPKIDLPAYKSGLIEAFIKDHKEILSIYESIMKSARNKEYTAIPLMLSSFSKMCLSHFNDEKELYGFMKALASSHSVFERKVATEFSMEMKNLSVSLFTILNQSNYIPVTDNSVDGFIKEFEELGNILQERISREEKILYPMYENSRKVIDIS